MTRLVTRLSKKRTRVRRGEGSGAEDGAKARFLGAGVSRRGGSLERPIMSNYVRPVEGAGGCRAARVDPVAKSLSGEWTGPAERLLRSLNNGPTSVSKTGSRHGVAGFCFDMAISDSVATSYVLRPVLGRLRWISNLFETLLGASESRADAARREPIS